MDNNVENTNVENVETLVEETEVLEPFVDTTNIVPVAPPVAVAPPPVQEKVETEVLENKENVEQLEEHSVTDGTAVSVDTTVQTPVPTGTPVAVSNVQGESLPGAVPVEEGAVEVGKPLNEVQIGEVKTSNFKYIMTILLFLVLGGTILFMPEISQYMAQLEYEKNNASVPKITTGTLKCELSRNSDNFDMNYEYKFSFTDNKFKKLTFVSETRGDSNLDEVELDKLHNECLFLKEVTQTLKGISVNCELKSGTMTRAQILNYADIDTEAAYSAYSEAGGVYPDYNYLEDMDGIEKNMKAAGYTCERYS